mmetsp:Transcript_3351/g.5136  ORF Transcript_3351/g.5136 Transcript_3351/m.5136 type:complete len:127 (+) Transcript_3351:162-542(+)
MMITRFCREQTRKKDKNALIFFEKDSRTDNRRKIDAKRNSPNFSPILFASKKRQWIWRRFGVDLASVVCPAHQQKKIDAKSTPIVELRNGSYSPSANLPIQSDYTIANKPTQLQFPLSPTTMTTRH